MSIASRANKFFTGTTYTTGIASPILLISTLLAGGAAYENRVDADSMSALLAAGENVEISYGRFGDAFGSSVSDSVFVTGNVDGVDMVVKSSRSMFPEDPTGMSTNEVLSVASQNLNEAASFWESATGFVGTGFLIVGAAFVVSKILDKVTYRAAYRHWPGGY